MPQLANKVVITCALTGSIHTPTMSDALPITPDQIAQQAIDAGQAGAAILHLHARDPKDGRPSPDPKIFMQAEDSIRDESVTGVQTCALPIDRKSTRLNSSHTLISYAVS